MYPPNMARLSGILTECCVSNEIVDLIAKRFIQRRDVRAIQRLDGTWNVDTTTRKADGPRIPWDRSALNDHIASRVTYGHYMLDQADQCKLFAFDVDLLKQGSLPTTFDLEGGWDNFVLVDDLRGAWRDRSCVSRGFIKLQFREIAHHLARGIYETVGLPCAAAYSGGKGIHVYGFTGSISAEDAREGAGIVLDSLGGFTASRGTNFFRNDRWPNLEIELFPKQSSLDGKDLGNLMRLPLGRNMKNPSDPTFFIDLNSPMDTLRPIDPVFSMTALSPWDNGA